MKEVRLTSSDHGKWTYCVDDPDKGERVSISTSDSAEPIHLHHWPDRGEWVYLDRIKTILVSSKRNGLLRGWPTVRGAADGDYRLLKINESESGLNWLVEIRQGEEIKKNSANFCAILGPYTLNECFEFFEKTDVTFVSDLLSIKEPEILDYVTVRYWGTGGRPVEKSWFSKLFP